MNYIKPFRSMTSRLGHHQEGFTLIELMIATVIFTIILVIATVAIIYVSDVYVKGQVVAQTQDTASSIEQTLTHDFEYTPNVTLSPTCVNGVGSTCGSDNCAGGASSCVVCGNGASIPCGICANPTALGASTCQGDEYFFCIGNDVYTYTLDSELGSANNIPASEQNMYSTYGLIETPTSNCQASTAITAGNGAQELLSPHQRLGALTITETLSGGVHSYSISLTVAYGDDDLLRDPATCTDLQTLNPDCQNDNAPRVAFSSTGSGANVSWAPDNNYLYGCEAESYGGRFCGISSLTTTVSARIN